MIFGEGCKHDIVKSSGKHRWMNVNIETCGMNIINLEKALVNKPSGMDYGLNIGLVSI